MLNQLIVLPFMAFPLLVQAGSITSGTDEQARLPYWQYQDEGLSVRFVQRLPDQTRGYFQARGFSAEHAELIAQSCVFQTIIRNISDKSEPAVLSHRLQDWRVNYRGQDVPMKTREDWAVRWQALSVAAPARLAFTWSVLPDMQKYEPGDYNWGMAIFNLAPASSFKVKLSWHQYGEQRSVTIPAMQCAADIHSDPVAQ
jgi:hypothetical protein